MTRFWFTIWVAPCDEFRTGSYTEEMVLVCSDTLRNAEREAEKMLEKRSNYNRRYITSNSDYSTAYEFINFRNGGVHSYVEE